MKLLAIDIGNTTAKAGLLDDWGHLLRWERFLQHELAAGELRDWIGRHEWDELAFVNVGAGDSQLQTWVGASHLAHATEITGHAPTPFYVNYATTSTLGADRLAAIAGGLHLAPAPPVLVVDAGTAVTYDYADNNGIYRGGAISPGLRMRYQALHQYTNGLPLLGPVPDSPLIGKHTAGSIHAGVFQGLAAELRGMIEGYRDLDKARLSVFLTGGWGPTFEKHLPAVNFAEPHLVLIGIHALTAHRHAMH